MHIRGIVMCVDRGLSPPVTLQVDEDSHQPGFLISPTDWDGMAAFGGSDKCVLHQILGVFGIGGQTPRKSIKAIGVRVEKQRQSLDGVGGCGVTDESCLNWRRNAHHLHKRVRRRFCWAPPAVPGNELEGGGVDGARTRDLRRDRPAF